MTYESVIEVESQIQPGVKFKVAKISFGRRAELMRRIRELARRMEFLDAGGDPLHKMDAAVLRAEIERLYVAWGLESIEGLVLDGQDATPDSLTESGPEALFREAVEVVRSQTGLSADERKN